MAKTRVFLVDDHPVVRHGIQLMISLEPDLTVCGEADNVPAALEKIPTLKPDVAIVDLSLKNGSGLTLIEQLHLQLPDLKVLVLSMLDEAVYAERSLRAGASGYVSKAQGPEKVIEAVRVLRREGFYFSDRVTGKILNRMSGRPPVATPIDSLSARELEVLELVGDGLGSREIAEGLHLSIKTVESHREHLKRKLGLTRASELTNFAFHWVSQSRQTQDLRANS